MSAPRPLAGVSVIIPAAGIGTRLGAAVPKQYVRLDHRSILEITLSRFLSLQPDHLLLVVSSSDQHFKEVPGIDDCQIVIGGELRVDSVLAGLDAVDVADDAWVMVHDAVRPFVRSADVMQLVDSVRDSDVGGLLAVPVVDTLKAEGADAGLVSGLVSHTVDREHLWQAQTPQMFRYGLLRRALQQHHGITDEAGALEHAGFSPQLVAGHRDNIKITEPADVAMAQLILASGQIS
jgi:2-C-methyl-D-erythritol 4-phosphate cytidylyltransferase